MKRSDCMSNAQWEVMAVVLERAPVAASAGVGDLLERERWTLAAVRTLLRRVINKGALAQRLEGNRCTYTPRGKAVPGWRWVACTVAVLIAGVTSPGQALESATQPGSESEVDTDCARVVSVAPVEGAEEVDPVQQLRIRFDRPMEAHHLNLEWRTGGFQLNAGIHVSADQKEFTLPVRLTAGQLQTLVINPGQGRGKPARTAEAYFVDTELLPAQEFRWSFKTKAAAIKPEAPKPRAIAVSAPSGGRAPFLNLVEITFDQAMRPPEAGLPYLQTSVFGQGPYLIPNIAYDSAIHRFTLPAVLTPGGGDRLTLTGFCSADGVPCDRIDLHYQIGAKNLIPSALKWPKPSEMIHSSANWWPR